MLKVYLVTTPYQICAKCVCVGVYTLPGLCKGVCVVDLPYHVCVKGWFLNLTRSMLSVPDL